MCHSFVLSGNDARSPRIDSTCNRILSRIVLQSGSKGKIKDATINYGMID